MGSSAEPSGSNALPTPPVGIKARRQRVLIPAVEQAFYTSGQRVVASILSRSSFKISLKLRPLPSGGSEFLQRKNTSCISTAVARIGY
jgi:hypothetical protein